MPDQPGPSLDSAIAFGPFRLFPARQLLLEGEKPLRLGSRALEILKVLVENAGTLVSKEDLVARVWPSTFVEEGNLRVHMAALRRALGDGRAGSRYVATVPGRGYRFVAPVSQLAEPQPSPRHAAPQALTHNLPVSLTRMVGRDALVDALAAQLPQRRFITVAGPGGIGKTTVALAVADELSTAYRDGVWFVDLAPLADPALTASALASVLGVAVRSENPLPGLMAFLRDKRLLLVLDSCERVIETAASLAEDIFRHAPGVHILATSREPLRADGERVQRLQPLEVPPVSSRLTAADAMAYAAIQLFVDRATANSDDFRLTDADAPIVADICRRLDGIALAIELAAGRIDVLGVQGVAARLNDRFRILTRGRRTALPRHQTLGAMLDWSYELLPEPERVVLRRLAVFAGPFTPEAGAAIASGEDMGAADVADCIANLVAKSLITADFGGAAVTYRLSETMHAYAGDKLVESHEVATFARRHAEYFRNLFRRAELESDTRSSADWLAAYGGQIDNVRAALDWAFGDDGEPDLGVALTIFAVPLWLQLSLMQECRNRIEEALVVTRSRPTRNARRDMQLSAALGSVMVYTSVGGTARATWTNALTVAESLDDVDYKLRSLWGLWLDTLNGGRFQDALALARRFYGMAAATADPVDPSMGERMIGVTLHFLGDQTGARRHIDRMLSRHIPLLNASHIVRFQFDQRVTARAFLARGMWLLGFADQARRLIERTVEEALSIGHVLSLCNTLGQGACPVALWCGDLDAAERYVGLLLDYAAAHTLELWGSWAHGFRGLVQVRRGETAPGLRALRSVLAQVPEIRSLPRYLGLLGDLASALGHAGETGEALAIIDEAIERAERRDERWCLAELLRVKGELLLLAGATNATTAATALFAQALESARAQSVPGWELRSAVSLARLQHQRGETAAASDLLAAVYGRFTEGFATADLIAARQLLDELA